MNRTQSAIRNMWGWAAKRDYIPMNFLAGISLTRCAADRRRHSTPARIKRVTQRSGSSSSELKTILMVRPNRSTK
jgi:hypothetical protein